MNKKEKSGLFLKSQVNQLRIPLKLSNNEKWQSFPLFNGVTGGLSSFSCHASSLSFDFSPHTPHEHKEEEILLLLSGTVDLILPDKISDDKTKITHLEPGQLVYYPAYFSHTLRTTSKTPANYLMLKWENNINNKSNTRFLDYNLLDISENLRCLDKDKNTEKFKKLVLFEGQTKYLNKSHCHISVLMPGHGYKPHADLYDVAIIVLEGEIETIGKFAVPFDVIFYSSGTMHGMYNPGKIPAKYIVFEFHSYYRKSMGRMINIFNYYLNKIRDPKRWKRKVKKILKLKTK